MIAQLSVEFPVKEICEVLKVSRSGYYRWKTAIPSRQKMENQKLLVEIMGVHQHYKRRYGSPRITRVLKANGVVCSENRVAALMKKNDIRTRVKRSFRPQTTIRAKEELIAPNRLKTMAIPQKLNAVWLGDITYIATEEGWLYLAGLMDLVSRKIVGWALEDQMPTALVECALNRALAQRTPTAELVHHTDRGCQYTSRSYQERLQSLKIQPSMSAIGYCYDNATMESFWSTLKTEALPETGIFQTKQQAKLCLFEYIEIDYNKKRLHSSLDYMSPEDFEAKLNTLKN